MLDPVLALRRRVRIAPGETARIAFWSGVAASRAQALALADKHRDIAAFDANQSAWRRTHASGCSCAIWAWTSTKRSNFNASPTGCCMPTRRCARRARFSSQNQLGPPALWSYGISGDLPIVLVRIDDEGDLEIVKQLLRAHEYWRLKRLGGRSRHPQRSSRPDAAELQQRVGCRDRDRAGARPRRGWPGPRQRVLAVAAIRCRRRAASCCRPRLARYSSRDRARLSDQLARLRETGAGAAPAAAQPEDEAARAERRAAQRVPALEFFNGFGGFAAAAREYVTVLEEGQWTPAPWINVIANPQFGFLVSADGTGSTWSMNARENQLTPWSNDPVSNCPAEAIYIRDEDSGDLWSATPLPIREPAHLVRHSPRLWLQPVRAHLARTSTRSSCNSCRSRIRSRYRG